MDQFAVVTMTLFFVIGVSMTHLLRAATSTGLEDPAILGIVPRWPIRTLRPHTLTFG